MGNADRDSYGGNLRKPLSRADLLHSQSAHAGFDHRQSVASPVRRRGHAASDVETFGEENREADLPVGFYKTKAKNIREICRTLIDQYGGKVPDEIDELLRFKGVGRKTANLVVTLGYKKPGICVDTHVHRISNRWGYIETKTPEKTELALRDKLPKQYWIEYNDLLVSFGQHLAGRSRRFAATVR